MINYLRQFGAWVTELKGDLFIRARFKLTLQKILSTLLFFFIAGLILVYVQDYQLRVHLAGKLADKRQEDAMLDRTARDLNRYSIWLLVVLGGVITGISYYLAGATLKPIRHIVRAQKRFIADASHELRTPLSIMKTNSEVVLMDGDNINPKESAWVLKSNIEEIDRMSKLIENLLRLSYYDNKTPDIPFIRLDLAQMVKSIVAKAKTLAYKKSIRLNVTEAETGEVVGNPTAIEQLVINLVKNAILYTPEGGTVAVTVKNLDGSGMHFSVRDTGIGIDPKELPNIFIPFYKTDSSKSIYSGGSGLGLTIVKKIIDRHSGEIKVESDLGKGTTVNVFFPHPDKIVIKHSVARPVTNSSSS